jgi:urease accessory protein
MKHLKNIFFASLSLVLLPVLAVAHPGHNTSPTIIIGIAHPVSGLDHLLTMLAVGIWAAQLGKGFRWSAPLTFVGVMIIGSLFGAFHVSIPFTELLIAIGLLTLGLLILTKAKLSIFLALPVIATFALAHGYAHGSEMTASGLSSLWYGLGFVISTLALHYTGLFISQFLLTQKHEKVVRLSGLIALFVGVVFLVF